MFQVLFSALVLFGLIKVVPSYELQCVPIVDRGLGANVLSNLLSHEAQYIVKKVVLRRTVDVDVSCDSVECGVPSDTVVSMRIVGGRRAEPYSFPWTVAIIKSDRMHCGGAIITDKHVLSAGHCFRWDDPKEMHVLIGLDNMDDLSNVEKRNLTHVSIHENFTSTAVRDENDIAIATLSSPVMFGPTIIPICLPKPGQDFSKQVGTIVGWGRIAPEASASRVLLKASLKILTDDECMHSKLAQHLKPTMMCAFSKGKDGCQGDSGGPFLVFEPSGRYVQAGVVSWGIGCADPRYPGVYTKVSNYIDWILEHSIDGRTCK